MIYGQLNAKNFGNRMNRPTIIGENEASDNQGKSLNVFISLLYGH